MGPCACGRLILVVVGITLLFLPARLVFLHLCSCYSWLDTITSLTIFVRSGKPHLNGDLRIRRPLAQGCAPPPVLQGVAVPVSSALTTYRKTGEHPLSNASAMRPAQAGVVDTAVAIPPRADTDAKPS